MHRSGEEGMQKNRIDIITLGCSKNLVDSEKLMKQFSELGYKVCHDSDDVRGETVIINTCGFIGDAKEESVNMILQFAEAKALGRIKRLYVMGCLSERYMNELKGEIPEVDGYFGKFDWQAIITSLSGKYDESIAYKRVLTTPPHYAYLKISEGCNRMCAYCAIPIITGRYKSRTMESIVREAEYLVSGGVTELQLIAQDLTYYGTDIYGKPKLAELITRISDIEGLRWLRLHYAYPADFPYDILPVMASRPNICKYLDIALQHISDGVLSRMLRHVTKTGTYELISRIRREVPGIHLRTTLMVGFPGETDAEFEELMQFVKDARFERMGAFEYSEEEGTFSARHYKDDVPPEVKSERLQKIMALQEQISEEVNIAKTGQELLAVIDRVEGDYYVARTEYDSPEVDPELLIKRTSAELKTGEYYKVRITGAAPYELYGEAVL